MVSMQTLHALADASYYIILFNIYVNDIVYESEMFKFVLFADDTNILISSLYYECVENKVNTELNSIHECLCTSNLSINLSKLTI